MNSDFKELLKIFNENRVKFLVIGGYAVSKYAEPRYTKDIDLWVATDRANAEAVFRSLKQFGAPLSGMSPDDFTDEDCVYQMGRPPARVDVLMSISGVDFAEAWPRRVDVTIDGIVVPFISKVDLIASKRAAGRPQDLIDADLLEQTDALDGGQ